jgi:hypothetical protein
MGIRDKTSQVITTINGISINGAQTNQTLKGQRMERMD